MVRKFNSNAQKDATLLFLVTNDDEFGVHGYDTTEKAMLPFFMARGPKIKKEHKVPPFKTVDLYYLFCQILEITPSKNNGTLANILDILIQAQVSDTYSTSAIVIITGMLSV